VFVFFQKPVCDDDRERMSASLRRGPSRAGRTSEGGASRREGGQVCVGDPVLCVQTLRAEDTRRCAEGLIINVNNNHDDTDRISDNGVSARESEDGPRPRPRLRSRPRSWCVA
jgi:hypothetical protein